MNLSAYRLYIWPESQINPTSGQILLWGGGFGLVRFYTTFIAALSRLFSLNTEIHTQFAPGPGQLASKCQTQIRFWKRTINTTWIGNERKKNEKMSESLDKMRIQNDYCRRKEVHIIKSNPVLPWDAFGKPSFLWCHVMFCVHDAWSGSGGWDHGTFALPGQGLK